MSTNTEHYDLEKPTEEEYYNVDVQNSNMDKIDTALKTMEDTLANVVTLEDGKIPADVMPDVDYLTADDKGVAGGVAELGSDGKVPDDQLPSMDYVPTSDKGEAGGVAELGSDGKVLSSQLPSYVDDVLEENDYDALPTTGETGKIYITLDDNKTYRWSGSVYVEVSASLALGETSNTAYRGDRGKIAYDHSQETGNPHGVTAASVGATSAVTVTFDEDDWSDTSLTISQSEHGKSSGNFTFTLRHLVGGVLKATTWAVMATGVTYDDDTGDITLTTETPFAGQITLIG